MFDIDADDLAATIEDTVDAFGSPVNLPNGVSLNAVKITNEKEIQKIMREDGEPLSTPTTVFLFDHNARGVVTKGTRIVNLDGSYLVDKLHTEVIGSVIVYVATGCRDAD